MKDESVVRTTIVPISQPMVRVRHRVIRNAASGDAGPQTERESPLEHDGHRHAGEADHRTDGQIELARDHQHAGAGRDDPELSDDREVVLDPERVVDDVPGSDRQEHEQDAHAGERPDFRAVDEAGEPAGFLQPVGLRTESGASRFHSLVSRRRHPDRSLLRAMNDPPANGSLPTRGASRPPTYIRRPFPYRFTPAWAATPAAFDASTKPGRTGCSRPAAGLHSGCRDAATMMGM